MENIDVKIMMLFIGCYILEAIYLSVTNVNNCSYSIRY